jgi:hypothetical protein
VDDNPNLHFALYPVMYPADPVPELLSNPWDYLQGPQLGASTAMDDINRTERFCGGGVKYLLLGYSSGAWVSHRLLHLIPTNLLGKVVGVGMYGDPLFERGLAIDRDYRLLDPLNGVALPVDPGNRSVPKSLGSVTYDACLPADPVCQAPNPGTLALCMLPAPANGDCPHLLYISAGATKLVADFLNQGMPTRTVWPVITSARAPDGLVGTPYSWTPTIKPTARLSYTWSEHGTLPPGLNFSTTTGALVGTPTKAGTYDFSVTATSTQLRSATQHEQVLITGVTVPPPGGGTWTPTEAPLPAGSSGGGLNSVSCATASACTAVGDDGLLVTGSGTAWSATQAPSVPGGTAGSLGFVSCSSATACAAVGWYVDSSGHQQGQLLTESGTSWTATKAPLPADAAADPAVSMTSVSCAAAATCAATGSYTDSSSSQQGLLLTWDGTSWTAAKAPLPADASATGPAATITSVSCASATTCAATGSYIDSSSFKGNQGLLLTWDGTSWTAAKAPLPADASAIYPVAGIGSVSCLTATACTAVGGYRDSSGAAHGLLLRWDGTSWTATQAPLPVDASATDPAPVIYSLSCATATACAATGFYRDSSSSQQGLLLTWDGVSWTATKAAIPAGAATDPGAFVSSVSCGSASVCAAVGGYSVPSGTDLQDQGLLLTWDGNSWTATQAPLPPGAAANPAASIGSVSCGSASACAAAGGYFDSANTWQGLLLTWSG